MKRQTMITRENKKLSNAKSNKIFWVAFQNNKDSQLVQAFNDI